MLDHSTNIVMDILWSDVKYIIFTFLCGDFQTSMLGRFRNIFLQSFYNGVLQKKESIWVIKSLTNTVERRNPNVQISAHFKMVQLQNVFGFEIRTHFVRILDKMSEIRTFHYRL